MNIFEDIDVIQNLPTFYDSQDEIITDLQKIVNRNSLDSEKKSIEFLTELSNSITEKFHLFQKNHDSYISGGGKWSPNSNYTENKYLDFKSFYRNCLQNLQNEISLLSTEDNSNRSTVSESINISTISLDSIDRDQSVEEILLGFPDVYSN